MNSVFRRFLVLFLLCAAPAFSQNVRYDNVAFSALGTNNQAAFIPNATITVCTSAGSGLPCTPKVSGLCLSASDVSCTQPNPTTSDAFGNYGFWIQPGTYIVTVTKAGLNGYSATLTLSCQIGSTCTITGPTMFTGALNASGVTTNSGPLELNNNPCSASAISPQTELNKLPTANSAGDFGGGSISFPCAPGYTVTAGLTVQNHGVHIRGGGFGTDFLASAAITGSDFLKVFAGGLYTFVRDFSDEDHIWDGNGVTNLNGIDFQDFQDRGLVRNVTFRNFDCNEIKSSVLNTTINSHIVFDNVITYPFRVKGCASSWNFVAAEYIDARHSKWYGNNGSGGKNAGPGFSFAGVNRSVMYGTASSLWTSHVIWTNNGANGSDGNISINHSCEALGAADTCFTVTGTAGAPTTRWAIIKPSIPSATAGATLLNCDQCTQGIYIGNDDGVITFTANSKNNLYIGSHVGASIPSDASANGNSLWINDSGNLRVVSNSGGNLILQPGGAATAATGTVRIPSTGFFAWRNNANSGDLIVTHNTSDQLNIGAGNGWVANITALLLPSVVGSTDVGAASSPYTNLWLGTAPTNNFKFAPAATVAARTVSILDPLANVALGFSYNATNPVYQTKRGVTGCTTAASIGGICATDITVTWGTAFPDANYSVTCTGSAPTAVPAAPFVTSGTKLAATVHINYFAITAVAASYATIDCIAVHD